MILFLYVYIQCDYVFQIDQCILGKCQQMHNMDSRHCSDATVGPVAESSGLHKRWGTYGPVLCAFVPRRECSEVKNCGVQSRFADAYIYCTSYDPCHTKSVIDIVHSLTIFQVFQSKIRLTLRNQIFKSSDRIYVVMQDTRISLLHKHGLCYMSPVQHTFVCINVSILLSLCNWMSTSSCGR